MSRFLKWRYGAALAVLAFVTFACSETAKNPVAPEVASSVPLFAATVPFNSTGQCLGDDAVQYNSLVDGVSSTSDPGTIMNCTANDIDIALATATTINGNAYHAGDVVTCNEGDTIQVGLTATLQQNANSERQDIGIWIALDGGGAETGSCNHYNLVAGTLGTVNADGDQCAGMASGSTTTNVDLGTIPVVCTDLGNDGFVDVGACVAWSIPGAGGDDQTCPDNADGTGASGQPTDFRAGTLPSNRSKCNCEPFSLPIIINKVATIEVRKVCVPTTDNGTFDLNIDGVVKKDNATCAGGAASTTGAVEVSAGTNADPGAEHNVSETDFTTANYTSTYACTGGTNAPASGTGTSISNYTVNPDEAIVCTFTNTRKAQLRIAKETLPDGSTVDFTFTPTNYNGGTTFTRRDNQAAFASGLVDAGSTLTTVETVPTGWDLTGRACVLTGTSTAKTFTNVTNGIQVTLAAGEDVTCTFTDTQRSSITIIKQTDPNGATGSFSFSHNVGSNSDPTVTTPFSLSDGGSQTFTNVVPNTYSVTEAALAGFDLVASGDGYTTGCVDATTNSSITLATGVASINLAPGESVTCTFVNRQRATVSLLKTENGTLPLVHAWTFEIRSGATTLSAGTVEATGTAVLATGVVNFVCSPEDANCVNVGGYANLVPGNYQLCETGMPAGYSNNITGFTPAGAVPEGGDNSTECVNITLAAGASGMPSGVTIGNVAIDNTPPPGGDARTIGYWKNWASCSKSNGKQYAKATAPGGVGIGFTLDGNLPQLIGDLNVTTCALGVSILDKRDVVTGTKQASDAAYALAAQLLAAKLNISAGAGTCAAANTAIAAGQALLDAINFTGTGTYLKSASANRTLALSIAATLDSYNNNTLC
jgi:plastocyanin